MSTESNTATYRWLAWKENRLVLPLIGSLIAMVIVVASLSGLMPLNLSGRSRHQSSYLLLLFPTFLAAGLGLVLVGQEREHGTMDWLRSLPLAPKHLIGLKLLIAAAWLAATWLIAMIFGLASEISYTSITPSVSANDIHVIPLSFPFWIVQSIVILLASFYASWKMPTSLSTIAMMAAIVSIPILSNFALHTYLFSSSQVFSMTFGICVLMIPILGWLIHRTAMRSLRPTPAPSMSDLVRANPFDPAMELSPIADSAPRTFVFDSSWTALVWQTLESSKWPLCLTSLMMLVGSLLPIPASFWGSSPSMQTVLVFASAVILGIGATWTGVLLFQGDGSATAVRFLTERGIKPHQFWLTRHVAIASVLTSLTLVFLVVASAWMSLQIGDGERTAPMLSPLTLVLLGSVAVAVGGWTSQVLREPAMSYLISPIAGSIVIGWLVYCTIMAMSPLILVSLVGVAVPLLATLIVMRRFAEGSDRPLSFIVGAVAVGLIVIVPLIPAIAYVRSIPAMDRAIRSSRLDEAKRIPRQGPIPIALQFASIITQPFQTPSELDQAELESRLGEIEQVSHSPSKWIVGLKQLRDQPDHAAKPNSVEWTGQFYNALELERLRFLASPTDDANEFEAWVNAAALITSGMRDSTLWSVQRSADVIEIWLADVLSDPGISDRLEDDLVQSSLAYLPSIPQRNEARRQAVLASWWRDESARTRAWSRFPYDIGLDQTPPALVPWTKDRRADAIVDASLALLEKPSPGQPSHEEARQRLHQLLSFPGIPWEDSVYGERLRSLPAIETIQFNVHHVGQYWGMAWEQQIEQLKEAQDVR